MTLPATARRRPAPTKAARGRKAARGGQSDQKAKPDSATAREQRAAADRCPAVCVLTGPPGSGKTHMLKSVLRTIPQAEHVVLDGSAAELAKVLSAAANDTVRQLVVLDSWSAVGATQRGTVLEVLRGCVAACRAVGSPFARNPVLIISDTADAGPRTSLETFADSRAYRLNMAALQPQEVLQVLTAANHTVFGRMFSGACLSALARLGNPRLALMQLQFLAATTPRPSSSVTTPTSKSVVPSTRDMNRMVLGLPSNLTSFEAAEACLRLSGIPAPRRRLMHMQVHAAFRALASDGLVFCGTLLQLGLPYSFQALANQPSQQPRQQRQADTMTDLAEALDAMSDADLAGFHVNDDVVLHGCIARAMLPFPRQGQLQTANTMYWPLRAPIPGAHFPGDVAARRREGFLAKAAGAKTILQQHRRPPSSSTAPSSPSPPPPPPTAWDLPPRCMSSYELADYVGFPVTHSLQRGSVPVLQVLFQK